MVEPHSSNFRVITTNFLGVRIFRKFTVLLTFVLTFNQVQFTINGINDNKYLVFDLGFLFKTL